MVSAEDTPGYNRPFKKIKQKSPSKGRNVFKMQKL